MLSVGPYFYTEKSNKATIVLRAPKGVAAPN